MTFQLAGDSSDIYEKIMVPLWFGRRADALIDVLALRPGENVLDVVCGMGVETVPDRPRGGRDHWEWWPAA